MAKTAVNSTRMRKWGNSWVFIIPREVREQMGLTPGDFILMRVAAGGILIARRASPNMITDKNELDARLMQTKPLEV